MLTYVEELRSALSGRCALLAVGAGREGGGPADFAGATAGGPSRCKERRIADDFVVCCTQSIESFRVSRVTNV